MYLAEWILWQVCIKSDTWLQEMGDDPSYPALPEPPYEDEITAEHIRMQGARFNNAETRGPVYACNDTYLEMRCGGMEEKRGFLTLISAVCCIPATFGIQLLLPTNSKSIFQIGGFGVVFLLLSVLVVGGGSIYLFLKYGFRFTRLESFTSRHLLIRFNRITRQVYLHRPPSCGGIATLPWDDISHDEVPSVSLTVGWYPPYSPLPFPNMVFVGKKGAGEADLKAEWEFIRRYMDEGGLEAVERPRISSQLPLPWPAFAAQFEALGPYLRHSGPLTWIGCFLISPAFIILGLSHWASLLLCWRPRWPKVIREAGQPGKPVPALTTMNDYPPKVRAALLENAHRWVVLPGSPPPRPPRFSGKRRGRSRRESDWH